MHIQKACGTGFSDMYGSRGIGTRQKKIWMGEGRGILGVFSANYALARQDFDLVLVTFSGFRPGTPLKPWRRVRPVPEMDSAPSK